MKKGFVLLIIIGILFFMGTALFLLSYISNKITYQTNGAFLETVERDMASSGIAWAKHNIKNGNIKKTGEEIQLDTAGIYTRGAQLSVKIDKITRKQAEITVKTFCSISGQSLKHSRKYLIDLKH